MSNTMVDTGFSDKKLRTLLPISMSYRNLGIWQLAHEVVINVHEMTLTKLPKLEMYEEGSQIRRSEKAVKSTIVEGYGRRRYKQEFVKYLTYSLVSCDETTDHLETLFETKSLKDEPSKVRQANQPIHVIR